MEIATRGEVPNIMNWIKCVPIVGTAISAGECIGAVVQGDFKRAGVKLAETALDGVMDVATVASGGLAAIATAPGKMAGKAAAKAVGGAAIKAVAGRALVGAVADNLSNNAAPKGHGGRGWTSGSSGRGSGSGGRSSTSSSSNQKSGGGSSSSSTGGSGGRDNEDERRRRNQRQWGNFAATDLVDPIEDYELGANGRVQNLTARIRYRNLRVGPRAGRGYTDEVEAHVHGLDFCHGAPGCRDGDQVGHIVGDKLGGPTDKKYNFFPQGKYSNQIYWHEIEKKIADFLTREERAGRRDASVFVYYEFNYPLGRDSDRPVSVDVHITFSDGTTEYINIPNI